MILLTLLLGASAHAGAPTAPYQPDDVEHVVFLDVGLDPAVLIGGGYGHPVRLGDDGPVLHLGYTARTAMGSSLDLGVEVEGRTWARERGFDLLLGSGLEAKILANRVHAGTSLNLRLTATPGYYASRGFLGLQLGTQATLTSLLVHTQAYKDIYEGVHDGFVGPSAPQWLAGVRGGVRAGPLLVEGHVTSRTSITLQDHAPYVVPVMVGIRVGGAW